MATKQTLTKYAEQKARRVARALGAPVKPTPQRVELFWKAMERIRSHQKAKLDVWLLTQRNIVVPSIGYGYTRMVNIVGDKLYRVYDKQVYAWHYKGYLVVLKSGPKWVRNWARLHLKVIETWQPLTLKVVKECVEHAKAHKS